MFLWCFWDIFRCPFVEIPTAGCLVSSHLSALGRWVDIKIGLCKPTNSQWPWHYPYDPIKHRQWKICWTREVCKNLKHQHISWFCWIGPVFQNQNHWRLRIRRIRSNLASFRLSSRKHVAGNPENTKGLPEDSLKTSEPETLWIALVRNDPFCGSFWHYVWGTAVPWPSACLRVLWGMEAGVVAGALPGINKWLFVAISLGLYMGISIISRLGVILWYFMMVLQFYCVLPIKTTPTKHLENTAWVFFIRLGMMNGSPTWWFFFTISSLKLLSCRISSVDPD